ncbi:MAG: diguanylate cyclase [Treponema sp.]
MYIFDKNTNNAEHYTGSSKKNKLTNNSIYAFFIDRYGIFYIGTDGFVNTADTNLILNKIAVPVYPQKKHRQKKAEHTRWEVRNLAYTPGAVWALFDDMLIRYSLKDSKITEFSLPAVYKRLGHINTAVFLYASDDSTLLISSSGSLYQFDTVQCQFEPISIQGNTQSKNWEITTLCRTSDGALWIGTQRHGLIYTDHKSQTVKTYTASSGTCSLQSDTIFFIRQDKKKQLWIGTAKGLYRYDSARDDFIVYLYRADNPAGISANAVNTFCEDSNGVLWFGTDGGGIFSFDPLYDTFQTYTMAHGLSSNKIISITDAGSHCLWVTTLYDLHLFNTEKGTIQFYGMPDSIQYNYSSCHPLAIHEPNLLFLGTDNGLIQLSQSALTTFLVRKIPVRIQSMKVEREDINVSRRGPLLSFDYTKNDIKFYFSAPHFFPVKKIAYAYKLAGFDKDWTIVSDRNYALYTKLPPGTYTFFVKNSIEPDSASDSIAFTIHPNFFFSAPMLVLYILLVLLFLFLLYKTRRLYLINQYTQSLEQKQKNLIQDNITLQELSMIDYLTNVGNRRSIDIMSEQILQKAKKNKVNLSVILIDVDFFKAYNDTYGHQAGDIVLKFIATALKTRIRSESDLIGRYGGEEFLIVLYNTTLGETLKIADEMRLSVEHLYVQFKEHIREKITISLGLHSEQSKNIRIFTDMIYKADCALYDAKQTGRNKVCVYEEKKNTQHSSWIINQHS